MRSGTSLRGLFVFIYFLQISCLLATEQEKINLAIAEFEARNVSAMDAAIISDFLRTELVRTEKYNVLDRKNMEMLLEEQKFQMSGCTSQECAVQMGRLLNVKRVIIGSLSKLAETYYITANIIDIETGKIIVSEKVYCTSAAELSDKSEELAQLLSNIKLSVQPVLKIPTKKRITTGRKLYFSDIKPSIQSGTGKKLYLRTALHAYKPGIISWINYLRGSKLPVGSPVVIRKLSKKKVTFILKGEIYTFFYNEGGTEANSEKMFNKFFSVNNPLANFTPGEIASIEKGKATMGMTKAILLLVHGCPSNIGVNREKTFNKTLEQIMASNKWIYHKSKFNKLAIDFRGEKIIKIKE